MRGWIRAQSPRLCKHRCGSTKKKKTPVLGCRFPVEVNRAAVARLSISRFLPQEYPGRRSSRHVAGLEGGSYARFIAQTAAREANLVAGLWPGCRGASALLGWAGEMGSPGWEYLNSGSGLGRGGYHGLYVSLLSATRLLIPENGILQIDSAV